MITPSLLFTIPEAAQCLSVSPRTMYRLVESGAIETIQIRGCRRIRRITLERYIDQLQQAQRRQSVGLS